MDPLATALATIITPLVTGVAGEAGKQAWSSLVGFLKARFGRDSNPVAAAEAIQDQPHDAARTQELAEALGHVAHHDDAVAAWLHGWLSDAAPLSGADMRVVNVVAGRAEVHGSVVQTHTMTGGITFTGRPPAR